MKKLSELIGKFDRQPPQSKSCGIHGEFVSHHILGEVWSRCPTCSTEQVAADKLALERQDREVRAQIWRRKVVDAGVPERFRDRTLEKFQVETKKQKIALEFAKNYADHFDDVLETGRCGLFLGPSGTGKTHLAAGISLQIMKQDNRTVMFSTVLRAIRRVKQTWRRDSLETESEAVASLVFPDLLVLDEVGVQFGSETEQNILFDFINERYEKRRPTLLMSNLTRIGAEKYLGKRIYDRLREGGGQVVIFDGESHRSQI